MDLTIMSSFILKIVTLWIIHFLNYKGTAGQSPEFMAPPNPCRAKVDDICSIHCKFITVTIKENGNLEPCQFCYCKNPDDSIIWEPETTSATPTPTTTTEPTTQAPGHYYVNGIHYVELKNACQLTEAMCPVTCLMFNVSGPDGRLCERCNCLDDAIGNAIPGIQRCLPMLSCPISKCPTGQQMAHGPNGCNFCKCIPIAGTEQLPPRPPFRRPTPPGPIRYSTPEPFETFIQMFCMPEPEYCPRYCPVTTYQVDSWICHRCTCPVGQTYVALQNPCNIHSNVCPSNCTVRQVQNPYNPSRTCDRCDCESQRKVLKRNVSIFYKKRNQLQSSRDNSEIKAVTLSELPTVTTIPPTTKTMPTTTAHPSPTAPNSLTQCYICGKASCRQEDLKYCPPGLNYCLSTITQNEDGTRNFTRSCLNENDCYNRWWMKSSTNSECLSMNNDRKGPTGTSLVCDFCCKGPGCNIFGRISDNHLYTGDDHFL